MFLKKRKNFLRKIYMTMCFFAVGLLPEGVGAACTHRGVAAEPHLSVMKNLGVTAKQCNFANAQPAFSFLPFITAPRHRPFPVKNLKVGSIN